MKTYTTTNIRVLKEDLKRLKLSALKENRSISAILRELIEQYIRLSRERQPRNPLSALEKYAVKTGDKKLSGRIDKIVYNK